MSIRFERVDMFCSHTRKNVKLLVEYSTPAELPPDAELVWERGAEECKQRSVCGDDCPGEDKVLEKLV